jgi:GrpB-like predicted nucleotidyltransferase (UPF0157 family)
MPGTITLVDYQEGWAEAFRRHAAIVSEALGPRALSIEHVGSTSVPGLAAKPIVDILLVVSNSADEDAYLPALEAAGYRLRHREPEFHEHRMFRTDAFDVHLHVYSNGSPEVGRMVAFRDRLRSNAADRREYERVKRELATHPWPDVDAYARAKTDVVERIIASASRALASR